MNTHPTQAAGFLWAGPSGADRVMVDGACGNMRSPAPFHGVIDAEEQRFAGTRKGFGEQLAQDGNCLQSAPLGTVEHPMEVLKMRLPPEMHGAAERCRDRTRGSEQSPAD